jgi:hypothetical protein
MNNTKHEESESNFTLFIFNSVDRKNNNFDISINGSRRTALNLIIISLFTFIRS